MRLVIPIILLLLAAGCHAPMETSANHYIHAGEAAMLVIQGQSQSYIALAKADTHALARAVDQKQTEALDKLLKEGKALGVANGTAVKVISESENERQVEVAEGPASGRKGWVPFEWLKVPARKLG